MTVSFSASRDVIAPAYVAQGPEGAPWPRQVPEIKPVSRARRARRRVPLVGEPRANRHDHRWVLLQRLPGANPERWVAGAVGDCLVLDAPIRVRGGRDCDAIAAHDARQDLGETLVELAQLGL